MLDVDLPFAAGVPKQAEALRRRHPAMLRTQYALKLRALNKKKKKKKILHCPLSWNKLRH